MSSKLTLFALGVLTVLVAGGYWFLSASYLFILPLISGISTIFLGFFRKKIRIFFLIFLLLTGWILPIGVHVYLNRSHVYVFIVPNDFLGRLTITKDEKNGIKIQKVDGKYIIDFSASQNLLVKNANILHHWQKIELLNESRDLLFTNETSDSGSVVLEFLHIIPGTIEYKEDGKIIKTSSSTDYDGTKYLWEVRKKG